MMNRVVIAVVCAAMSAGAAFAELHTTEGQIVREAGDQQAWLVDQAKASIGLTSTRVAKLELPLFEGQAFEITVPILGAERSVVLQPHSVRSERFEVIAISGDGTQTPIDPGPVKTYRGHVNGLEGAQVAGVLEEIGLTAIVLLEDGTKYVIEPLVERVAGAGFEDHAVFRSDEVISEVETSCGVVANADDDPWANMDREDMTERGLNMKVAEVGCDTDVQFLNALGSEAAATTRIEAIINGVNTQYENQVGITHEITTIILRTSEPDPYTSTNIDTTLGQLRTQWLSVHDNIQRDMAHLFSGKNFDGSTIGLAWVGVVCNSNLHYAVSETFQRSSFGCKTDLVAHEMGHNWNAPHCSGGCNATMNAGLTCTNNFITSTRNIITTFKNSRGCLSNPAPATPPGAFDLLSPADGVIGVVNFNPSFQWQTAATAQTYTVLVDDDSNFSSPVVQENTSLTNDTVAGAPFQDGQLYYWKVVANNSAGSTQSSSVFTFVTEGPLPGSPVLATPVNGAVVETETVSFLWTETPDALEYILEVDDNPDFSSPEVSETFAHTGSGSKSYITSPGELADQTQYNWRVTATNFVGESSSTPVEQSFTVQLPVVSCEGDADGNGAVDVNDISFVLFRLGDSGTPGSVDGDADENGVVDVNDISYVLFRLGGC